jgi:hypothetical protein
MKHAVASLAGAGKNTLIDAAVGAVRGRVASTMSAPGRGLQAEARGTGRT